MALNSSLDTDTELSFLSEMKDIDLLGDSLTGGGILSFSPVRTFPSAPTPMTKSAGPGTIASCIKQRRLAEQAVCKDDDLVAPDKYQAVLESRFVDLRNLYYHTKEQKLRALDTVRSLEKEVSARDAHIETLRKQLAVQQKPTQRAALSSLPPNSVANQAAPPSPTKKRVNIGYPAAQALQEENALLREKLRALQDWALALKPPPQAMTRV
ncbi:hypothetical protein DIPPA_19628 [Diplonema papillatum]|nr:hypothetical protein DIPPA_19628 [Diplonema papillatum]KAJ9459895.1 hypothetical protein DIPPA_19628 [Diplonema papillatum]